MLSPARGRQLGSLRSVLFRGFLRAFFLDVILPQTRSGPKMFWSSLSLKLPHLNGMQFHGGYLQLRTVNLRIQVLALKAGVAFTQNNVFVIRSLGVACLGLWFGSGFLLSRWDVCLFFKLRFSSNSLIARALKKTKML